MIAHAPQLDAAYGATPWEPFSRVTFLPAAGSGQVAGTTLTPTDGTVRHDATTWPRTTLQCVLPTGVTPDLTTPPVTPWGGRIRVDLGFRVSGQLYTFTAATLEVTEVDIARPDGLISVTAASREALVNEDRAAPPVSSAAGLTSVVLTNLLRASIPGCPILNQLATDPTLVAGAFTLDGDQWPTVDAIADAASSEVFFDELGSAVFRPVPVKAAAPALTVTTGTGGSLTGYQSARRWAYNRVAIVYDDGTSKRTGLWQDTSVSSPTRVGGPYGRHTRVDNVAVDPGKLPTQPAADAAAASVARRAAAPFRQVTLRAIPAPWLTPGDTIRVQLLGAAPEDLLVAAVEYPLSGLDPMIVTCRDDQSTNLGV